MADVFMPTIITIARDENNSADLRSLSVTRWAIAILDHP
jgi:hypothetical protein